MKELVLGGARSGKSAVAEQRALAFGLDTIYLATAEGRDLEMAARIATHRARRPSAWKVVEEPIALARALHAHAADDRCLVVDCLTLWLSNVLTLDIDADATVAAVPAPNFERERAAFVAAVEQLPGKLVMVSNEVGMGLVPLGALARRFQDEAGRLHQDLARLCDRVTWVVAGIPLVMKGA